MRRLRIPYPVIVEGKYDKIKLDSVIDAHVIVSEGFGIFTRKEKQEMVRRLAEKGKVIVLTDPDGAGLTIRSFLASILPPEQIINLYVPAISGKERRKADRSAEGLLGVEGMDAALLRKLFAPFEDYRAPSVKEVTKADFYKAGLSGGTESAIKRKELCRKLALPENLSANALLAVINMLYGYDQYKELL